MLKTYKIQVNGDRNPLHKAIPRLSDPSPLKYAVCFFQDAEAYAFLYRYLHGEGFDIQKTTTNTLINFARLTTTEQNSIGEPSGRSVLRSERGAVRKTRAERDGIRAKRIERAEAGQPEPFDFNRGKKLETKKAKAAKETIKRHSRNFGGTLSDPECMKLAGISRNSFYKYKRELLNDQSTTA